MTCEYDSCRNTCTSTVVVEARERLRLSCAYVERLETVMGWLRLVSHG